MCVRSPGLEASAPRQGPSASWLQHSILVLWRAPAPVPGPAAAQASARANAGENGVSFSDTVEPMVGEYLIVVQDASGAEVAKEQRSSSRLKQRLLLLKDASASN